MSPENEKENGAANERKYREQSVEEAIRYYFPLSGTDRRRKDATEKTFAFVDAGDSPEEKMAYLGEKHPDLVDLVSQYYALADDASLASPDIQARYREKYEDAYNIADLIELDGKEAYESVIRDIQENIVERKEVARTVHERLAVLGKDALVDYCYMRLCEDEKISRPIAKLFGAGGLEGVDLMQWKYSDLVSVLEELDRIDATDKTAMKTYLDQEAEMRKRAQRKNEESRRSDERKGNLETLKREYADHVLFELIRRMDITYNNGMKITNTKQLQYLSGETLKDITAKAKELDSLAQSFGGVDWYRKDDYMSLLDELFTEKG